MDICLINRWEFRKIGSSCINVIVSSTNERVEVLVWYGCVIIILYICVYRDVIFCNILLAREEKNNCFIKLRKIQKLLEYIPSKIYLCFHSLLLY